MTKAIILLSGGLDSVVSLASIFSDYSDILALTFNYGQKSFIAEKKSSEKIASFYNIKHRIIDLDWLADISTSSLNTDDSVPSLTVSDLMSKNLTVSSSKSVWVPNRNGLFVNIAATFAEALKYDVIVLGANKEEAQTFKDNSIEFLYAINNSLKNSMNREVKLIAPLIDCSKPEIVKRGISLNVPFNLISSCYVSENGHCGKCESCVRLLRALEENGAQDIIEMVFKG